MPHRRSNAQTLLISLIPLGCGLMVVSLVLDQKAVLSWILRIAALGLLAVTSVGLLSLNLKSAEDRD